MLRVVNGCSVVGRVAVKGRTSLFSALVWGVWNWGVGWFAGTMGTLAGISTRTPDRLTLGLINFCSQGLSTWVVGSYPQVELLVYLKHASVLTALGFTGLTSILLFISKKQTWPEVWIQYALQHWPPLDQDCIIWKLGLLYTLIKYCQHLALPTPVHFLRFRDNFCPVLSLLVINNQIFTRESHSAGLIFTQTSFLFIA